MNERNRYIFSGMQVLIEQEWKQGLAVIAEEHLIQAIIPEDMIKHHLPASRYEFPADHYLVPGFIDLHVHGSHGNDVMDASEKSLIAISHSLAAEGVTGFLATTLPADNELIEAVLQTVTRVLPYAEGAAILGVHLEGPFIAMSKRMAAFEKNLQLPNPKLVQNWQTLSNSAIKIVTLAPELRDALPFIQALHKMEIIASIGHTYATYEETVAAIAAGCSQATHFLNAMRGIHQCDPGVVGAILLAKNVMIELIVDAEFLHPAIVELCLEFKNKEHLLLVTNAISAKGLVEGHYELRGQPILIQGGRALLVDGTLAGSTLCMPQAIKNMVQFSHCSLIDAIYMASYNPAHVLGLEGLKGKINVGKMADLVILNPDLKVLLTMREGKVVFKG
jgi:N-acetylglucosamine-6-phosphate deacetylase